MAKAHGIALEFPPLRRRLDAPEAGRYADAPGQTFEHGLGALRDGLTGASRNPNVVP